MKFISFLLLISVLSSGCQKGIEPLVVTTSDLYGGVELLNPGEGYAHSIGDTVKLVNTHFITSTNNSGYWSLKAVPIGVYFLSITKAGYSYVRVPIAITASSQPIRAGYFTLYKKPSIHVRSITLTVPVQNDFIIDGTLSSVVSENGPGVSVCTYLGLDSIADSLIQRPLTYQMSYPLGTDKFQAEFHNYVLSLPGVTTGSRIYFASYTITYPGIQSSECDTASNIISFTIQ